ncbi:MAG: hypothetical protein QM730_10860 [Anaerolineales bacterium]
MFLVLWAAALMAVRLQLIFPRSVIVWLSESPDPQRALIAFGALVSSGVLGLLRLGIEVPPLKAMITSETVRTYITGVPLWVLGSVFAVSVGAILLVFPSCSSPAFVTFHVEGRQETYRPNETLVAVPGEFLAITAQSTQQDAILSCKWQYIGETFETIGASSGCDINLKLSGQPGNGLLTLQASQDFCNQSSIFSLGIQVTNP